MKKAFVIMPFGGEFDRVYSHLIESCLRKAGFSVSRADEILNQQSIMNDVIGGIDKSDVVVADLSGANANVYYELGIAHAVRRNVVLLARHGEDPPFDLAGERAIRYGTDFSQMRVAEERFQELMHEVSEGSVKFGSPVIAYGDIPIGPPRRGREDEDDSPTDKNDDHEDEEEDGDLGLLDFRVRMEDGMGILTRAAEGVGQEFQTIGTEAERASGTMKTTTDVKNARKATRALAASLEKSASSIWSHSADFWNGLNQVKKASNALMDQSEWPSVANEEEADEARGALVELDKFPVQADTLIAQMEGLVDTIAGVPNLERKFNQARRKLMEVIVAFSQRVDDSKEVVSSLGQRIRCHLDRFGSDVGPS